MKRFKSVLSVIIFLYATVAFAQKEGDRIVAIAGNQIITESDFQYQVQLYARQNQLTEISPYLAQQIFQSLLTNKIMLAKAEQDSIEVSEEEITKELDGRIKTLIGQVGSQQKLEEVYGMSLSKIKSILKEDLKNNLKIEKLKREKFKGGLKISDKEIRDFYNVYKDSLPDASEEFEIAHIFVERKVSDAEKEIAKKIAEAVLDSIKQGVDFSELAKRNSGDSMSAIVGGDLGYAKKGTFVKEFEEAVYSLKIGEVSEIVETQFGYHIIKLTDKQGENVKSQHILIKYPLLESSDFETINFLKNVKDSIVSGKITFEAASLQYSQDPNSKEKGGYIGRVPSEKLDSATIVVMRSLEPGQISDPVRFGNDMKYGYEIFKVIAIFPPHRFNLTDDYERIKGFAQSFKENKEMEDWINEIRESVYVDIKM
ncbi:MAG TPA: peptidylprolyl isomerase [Ignavibacteria bacterium]|nr:peptidylprolyl isomerase [Ignavibacteria bacterium]